MTGDRSAATRPAKPFPIGIRTPRSHLASSPTAARATSSLRLLVPQENRNGVGVESLANAREQLVEELIQVEMRESGVGNQLKSVKAFGVAGEGHA